MIQKPIEVRIPDRLGKKLKEEVFRPGRYEHVVFALISSAETTDKSLLLIKKLFTLHEEQYVETTHHGAMWRGSATIHIINEAIEKKLGIIIFHAHGHKGKVGLSKDDLQSAKTLLPTYQNLVPWRPHGSIVIGEEHASGLILMPETAHFREISRMRWLRNTMVDWDDDSITSTHNPVDRMYHRQALLIGNRGQRRLQGAKIAVVGLSGGGSHVVQQAAHLGIGEIIGIDDDVSEEENRHRMVGLSRFNVRMKHKKTKVMANLVSRINRTITFTPVPYKVPSKEAIDRLKRADIVVGCVDSLTTRSDIQEICLRYCIPYVDIGLLITPNGHDSASIGGNVLTLVPGQLCMWCMGFLSGRKLSVETGGKPRSYFQGTDKQAQVVSFNGLLASAAMNEVMQLLVGYRPGDYPLVIKKFDGMTGTLENWSVKPNLSCSKCEAYLGAGDTVWLDL